MPISEIIHVTISALDAAPSQASFDKILIAGYHTVGSELIRDYTDVTSFQTDFALWPGMLAMGNAFFAQSPHPVTLAVGRLTTARAKVFTLAPSAVNSQAYTVYVNGTAYTYTSDSSASVQEIVEGLKVLIDLGSVSGLTVTEDNVTLTLTMAAGVWASVEIDRPDLFTFTETTTATGLATELTAITTERDDFYGVALEHQSEAYINAAAAWVLTQRKLYGASTPNSDVAGSGSTDVASDLETATNNRTFVMWSSHASAEYPEVGRMASRFVKNPGSGTWNFKTIAGATAQPVTGTQVTNIAGKQASLVRSLGGLTITYGGKVASGRYIDVQHGTDWLQARIEEGLFGLLARVDKVPYTEEGLAMIQGVVTAILREAVRNQFIADDDNLEVFITPVDQQNANDRASRIVRGVNFRGRLAGAVEEMFITGSVFP